MRIKRFSDRVTTYIKLWIILLIKRVEKRDGIFVRSFKKEPHDSTLHKSRYQIGYRETLLLLILTAVFFSIPIIAAPDSSAYVHNAHTLLGTKSFDSWRIHRGPTLSLFYVFRFFCLVRVHMEQP